MLKASIENTGLRKMVGFEWILRLWGYKKGGDGML